MKTLLHRTTQPGLAPTLQPSSKPQLHASLHARACTHQHASTSPRCMSHPLSQQVSRGPTPSGRRYIQRTQASTQSTEALVSQEHELPTEAIGQVFSTFSNFVRVEVSEPESSLNGLTDNSGSNQSGVTGHRQLLCTMRAMLRKLGQHILVGDYVHVGSIDWAQNKGQVTEVMLPRTNELTDPSVANVDFALLVFALTQPPLEDVQLSRFLVCMEASGIPFRLLLNKADLVTEEELGTQTQKIRSWGYDPLVVSSATGQGIEDVTHVLQHKTSVMAGPSGAGKSSLINVLHMGRHRADAEPAQALSHCDPALPSSDSLLHEPSSSSAQPSAHAAESSSRNTAEGDRGAREESLNGSSMRGGGGDVDGDEAGPHTYSDVGNDEPGPRTGPKHSGATSALELGQGKEGYLAVGELSKRGKGRHTTTTVTLIRVRGGLGGRLVDTPGFSYPSLDAVSSTELASYFPEMKALRESDGPCRFSDCKHVNEPGCVILKTEQEHTSGSSSSSSSTGAPSVASGSTQDETSNQSKSSLSHSHSKKDQGNVGVQTPEQGAHAGSDEGIKKQQSSDSGSSGSSNSSSSQESAATFSLYNELVPPSIAKLIEREGGVEEWLVEMQSVSDMGGGLKPVALPPPPARVARHPIYVKFLTEIKAREEKDEKSLQAGKQRREGRLKVKVGQGGRQRREAKLQQHKHRRMSRTRFRQETLMGSWNE